MKKDLSALHTYLRREMNSPEFKKKKKKVFTDLYNKHEIPISLSSDIINGNRDLTEFNQFIAYCFLETVDSSKVEIYFSDIEIQNYKKKKYVIQKDILPIKIPAIQVTDDQWIAAIDSLTLMKWRENQLIIYNENTQRVMKHIIDQGEDHWVISVNWRQVKEIKRSLLEGHYIPNTITLNINEDGETDFDYINGEIVINSSNGIDILDGYHRLVALSQIYSLDPSKNYPMELRIVNFPEFKAKHFIWQEDQKTKMRKVDSNSMNQYNPAVMIVERLNKDPQCEFCGLIMNSGEIIKASVLATSIDKFMKIKSDKLAIRKATNEIKSKLNELVNYNDDLIAIPWTEAQITICIYCISKGYSAKKTYNAMCKGKDIDVYRPGKISAQMNSFLKEV